MKRILALSLVLAGTVGACTPAPVVAPRPTPLVTNDVTPDAEWRKNPPASGPIATFNPPKIRTETLPNGLRLWIAPTATNVLAAHLVLAGPSAYPNERAFGMMVTLSVTQSENSAARRDLEENLVRWTSSRGPDWFTTDFTTLPAHADVVFRAIAAFGGASLQLGPAAINLNAPLVAGDIAGRTQYRNGAAWITVLRATLGDAHPYTRISSDGGGANATIDHAEAARIHDELYDPSVANLVLAGAVDDGVLAAARRELSVWKAGAHAKPAPPPVAKTTKARLVVVDWPGSTTAEIRGGALAPPRSSPDWSPFVVALDALTARPTSRLRAVVEGADPSISPRTEVISLRGDALFHFHCSAKTDAVAATIAASEKAFQALVTQPVDGDELASIRTYERLSYPARFEASADVALMVSEIPSYGLPEDDLSARLTHFVEAPAAEVARVARERLGPGAVRWVVVGDWKSLKGPLRKLDLGTIELRSTTGERVGDDDGS